MATLPLFSLIVLSSPVSVLSATSFRKIIFYFIFIFGEQPIMPYAYDFYLLPRRNNSPTFGMNERRFFWDTDGPPI